MSAPSILGTHPARRGNRAHLFVSSVAILGLTFVFATSLFSQRNLVPDGNHEACPPWTTHPFRVDQVVFLLVDALTPTVAVGPKRASDVPHSATFTALRERLYGQAADQGGGLYSDVAGFVSVADSPTTTSQRLKAMMTGSIPAFIEAGSNFNSDAVEEDNLIRQLNGSAAVLGDDTWLRLFPEEALWRTARVYPSFDVRDLDTVDAGVLANLADAIRNGRDAPFIIGHFLGVDHAGHSFNARHELLYRKVRQLNIAVRNVTSLLADESRRGRDKPERSRRTLLLVLGDHGMTESGDHGGGMPEETDTFFYAHIFDDGSAASHVSQDAAVRRAAAASSLSRQHAELRHRAAGDLKRVYESYDFIPETRRAADTAGAQGSRQPLNGIGAMHQIDLLPTIAAMLGLALPRSNVGRVIPEVLLMAAQYPPLPTGPSSGSANDNAEAGSPEDALRTSLAGLLACNARQIHAMAARDIKGYKEPRTAEDVLSAMDTQSAPDASSGSSTASALAVEALWAYMGDVATQTRLEFATMDDAGLWAGSIASCIVALLCLVPGALATTAGSRPASWLMLRRVLIGVVVGTATAVGIGSVDLVMVGLESDNGDLAAASVSPKAAQAAGILVGAVAASTSWAQLAASLRLFTRSPRLAFAAVAVFALRVATAFGNSFVVDEESIVLFLLASALTLRAAVALDASARTAAAAKGCRWRVVAAPVGVLLAMRVAFVLGQRDRSFEEVQIKPDSALRIFFDSGPLDGVSATVPWVYDSFKYAVYQSSLVHVLFGIALATVAVAAAAGRSLREHGVEKDGSPLDGFRPLTLVALVWILCLCRSDTAIGRAAHAACLWQYLRWAQPRTRVVSRGSTEHEAGVSSKHPASATDEQRSAVALLDAVVLHLMLWVAFFAGGFQTTFTTIDWHAAFVGVPEYSLHKGAILVLLHMGAPALMTQFAIRVSLPRARAAQLQSRVAMLQLVHLAVASVGLAKHRRHLMVWEIFMPHYVFVLGYTIVTLVSMPIVGLLARLVRPEPIVA